MRTFNEFLEAKEIPWNTDYFGNKARNLQGSLKQLPRVRNISEMTPEKKQEYWNKKLNQAKTVLKTVLLVMTESLKGKYGIRFSKAIDYMYGKIASALDNFTATHRKGGIAKPDTISSLTTSGWSEGISDDVTNTFQEVKNRYISVLKKYLDIKAGQFGKDKDVAMLMSKMSSVLIKTIEGYK